MTPIYLGLGSNLGDREWALRAGLRELARHGISTVLASSLYDTDPVGFVNQPSFLNMAVEVAWAGSPQELLEHCLAVENALGRIRGIRDGPRTLDIDLLLAGDLILKTRSLQIPHPRMHQRRFVLRPLTEIAPGAVHPLMRLSAQELLDRCEDISGVRKAADPFTVEPPDPTGYNPAASRGKNE